jgi:hypothetical protein
MAKESFAGSDNDHWGGETIRTVLWQSHIDVVIVKYGV